MTSVDLTITSRFAGGDSVKNQVSARYSLRDIGYNDEKGSPSETFREARLTYKIPITEGEPPVA